MKKDLIPSSIILREKEVLKQLGKVKNDHLVQLYEYSETENNIYLVFEFCNGGNLKVLMK